MEKLLELQNINMKFDSGENTIHVLKDVSLTLYKGISVALIGQSGSGKTTLLQIAALLEKPTSGRIIINNNNAILMTEIEKTIIRRKKLGFVYQFHNLLSDFTTLENVMIPMLTNNVVTKKAIEIAKDLLNSVGLSHRINHNPLKLSGGEKQRVAIARALANDPDIIIADEPTGNLDPQTAFLVFEMLLKLVRKQNKTLLMATHNLEMAKMLDKQILIENIKINF